MLMLRLQFRDRLNAPNQPLPVARLDAIKRRRYASEFHVAIQDVTSIAHNHIACGTYQPAMFHYRRMQTEQKPFFLT